MGVLPPGTEVSALASAGEYVEVETSTGQRGWVSGILLAKGVEPAWKSANDRYAQASALLEAERSLRERQEKRMVLLVLAAAVVGVATGFLMRGVLCRRRYGWLEAGQSRSRWQWGHGRLMFVRRKRVWR